MLRALLSVSFWTLLSRITGFLRDILMAAIIGAGPLMDAFSIAFRLPNHFRAIFAEGAFSASFIPAFTRIRTQAGEAASRLFQGQVFSILLLAQLVLLLVVFAFTPQFLRAVAPGFSAKEGMFDLAVTLTRITFPYLPLVTMVAFWGGVLNSMRKFQAAAAAPVLLNLSMIATLLMAGFFSTPAHASAWGVTIAGVLEALLLAFAAKRAGVLVAPKRPRLTPDLRQFFRAFGPAVIGSMGVQIAMLLDTILVTLLPTGSASALYYADRLYQLPVGVIGIAAGTVLLPEMSRLIAAGEVDQAHAAQNRAFGFTFALTAPFLVVFLLLADLIVAGFFARGAFSIDAVQPVASVLMCYAVGLMPLVLLRSLVASFHARGNTKTPLYASLTGIAVNLTLKLIFSSHLGAAGLALATAIGAWVNFLILAVLAYGRDYAEVDLNLEAVVIASFVAAVMMSFVCAFGLDSAFTLALALMPSQNYINEAALCLIGTAGFFTYGLVLVLLVKFLRVGLKRR